MCIQRAVLCIGILFAIALNAVAGFTSLKTPQGVKVSSFTCVNDDIWYVGTIANTSEPCVGKLNAVTKKEVFFKGKEIGDGVTSSYTIVAADSMNVALTGRNLFIYNGAQWKRYDEIKSGQVCANKSGMLWGLSSDSIICIAKGSIISSTACTTAGVSGILQSISVDDSDNVWVVASHGVARYNGTQWNPIACDDTTSLLGIHKLVDNSICFVDIKGVYHRIVDGKLEEFQINEEVQNNPPCKDFYGNFWSLSKSVSNDYRIEMSTSDTSINVLNAKAFGWKNWPEYYIGAATSAIIKTCNKHVYLNFDNGFYHYAGDTSNLIWEWLPISNSIDLADFVPGQKLYVTRDSSVYISREWNELVQYKSGTFHTLPGIFDEVGKFFTVYMDHKGTLWAGSRNIHKYENSTWKKIALEGFKKIDNITEDSQGRLIAIALTTGNEQVIVRKAEEDWEIINRTNSDWPNYINSLTQDYYGNFWAGSSGQGICTSTDLFDWKCIYLTDSDLSSNYINSIFASPTGPYVPGSSAGVYATICESPDDNSIFSVFKYDGTSWTNLGYPSSVNAKGTLFGDTHGRIWYGSASRSSPSLSYYDNSRWNTIDRNLQIYDINEDYFGKLLLCTGKGIYLYDSTKTADVITNIQSTRNVSPLIVNRTSGTSALIKYDLEKSANITLEVFTLQGKSIRLLKKGFQTAGSHDIDWKNQSAGGIYLIKLTTPVSSYISKFSTY